MKIRKLSEIANVSTGYPFDGYQYSDNGIRVVRGENIGSGSLHWEQRIDKRWNESIEKWVDYELIEGDIVMQMDGNIGKNISLITSNDIPSLIAQRVGCIRAKGGNNQLYIYYILRSAPFLSYIKRCATGTSIQHVSLKQIGDFTFPFHSIEQQNLIATVLSSLDKKISINRAINKNLPTLDRSSEGVRVRLAA